MAQPFGVGDVVGGRYRITHHVVTSADQDIVFQGIDQVLSREVSILLAAKSNAKQVATSAKELAAGERESGVQVLDLGLTEDRTYLISSLIDPNALLDLVVPDAAPYVEPFFTDSLGSELFGQSRVMEPETYEDDAEYYARLHGLAEEEDDAGARYRRRRPAFLDKVSDQLNRRLGTERDADNTGTTSDEDPQAAPETGQHDKPQSEQRDAQTEAGAQQNGVSSPAVDDAPATEEPSFDAHGSAVQQPGPPRPSAGTHGHPSVPFPVAMPTSSGTAAPSSAVSPESPAQPNPPTTSGAAPFTSAPSGTGSLLGSLPPSLADFELVGTSAQADTEEEFGVRSQQDGSFQPTGPISFGGAAAPLGRSGSVADQNAAAQPGAEFPPHHAAAAAGQSSVSDRLAEGEEVVDDPPAEPVPDYDRPLRPVALPGPPRPGPEESMGFTGDPEAAAGHAQQPESFTGLIRAVNDDAPRAFPAAAAGTSEAPDPAAQDDAERPPVPDLRDRSPGIGRWLAALVLTVLVVAAAVIAFIFLGSAE